MISVVSTGLSAPTKAKCIESVAMQVDCGEFEHIYVEAAEQTPRKTPLQNIWEQCRDLPSDRVVVLLDGDDWLAHPGVLARVRRVHADGAWVTYGSFVYADGRPGFAAPVRGAPRTAPWTATHLKTVRAGLIQRIRLSDMQLDGTWNWAAADVALMLPALEMAGGRCAFLSEVLYVYNYANSWIFNAAESERRGESDTAARLRALPAYREIESL